MGPGEDFAPVGYLPSVEGIVQDASYGRGGEEPRTGGQVAVGVRQLVPVTGTKTAAAGKRYPSEFSAGDSRILWGSQERIESPLVILHETCKPSFTG